MMQVRIHGPEPVPEDEQQEYVKRGLRLYGAGLEALDIRVDGEFATIEYTVSRNNVERIYRLQKSGVFH